MTEFCGRAWCQEEAAWRWSSALQRVGCGRAGLSVGVRVASTGHGARHQQHGRARLSTRHLIPPAPPRRPRQQRWSSRGQFRSSTHGQASAAASVVLYGHLSQRRHGGAQTLSRMLLGRRPRQVRAAILYNIPSYSRPPSDAVKLAFTTPTRTPTPTSSRVSSRGNHAYRT